MVIGTGTQLGTSTKKRKCNMEIGTGAEQELSDNLKKNIIKFLFKKLGSYLVQY